MNNKLCSISVRLSETDQSQLKAISDRLGVNNSDLVRYAIKRVITQLYALNGKNVRGKKLLPLFIKHFDELNRHFDISIKKLEYIFNSEVDNNEKIEMEDLELLSLFGMPDDFSKERIKQITGKNNINNTKEFITDYLIQKYN